MKNAGIDFDIDDDFEKDLDLDLSENEKEIMDAELAELAIYTPIVEIMKMASPKDHPDEKVVQNWKNKFGKIYISTILDEMDVYVWRPILRQEWKALIAEGFADEFARAEALVEKCVLFPRLETILYKKPAGVLPALETKIMFQSGFVSDQLLISSIREIN